MKPEGPLQCSQEPALNLLLNQMNPQNEKWGSGGAWQAGVTVEPSGLGNVRSIIITL
jgi:hypothetical protein